MADEDRGAGSTFASEQGFDPVRMLTEELTKLKRNHEELFDQSLAQRIVIHHVLWGLVSTGAISRSKLNEQIDSAVDLVREMARQDADPRSAERSEIIAETLKSMAFAPDDSQPRWTFRIIDGGKD